MATTTLVIRRRARPGETRRVTPEGPTTARKVMIDVGHADAAPAERRRAPQAGQHPRPANLLSPGVLAYYPALC
jgi:hypothetical protein